MVLLQHGDAPDWDDYRKGLVAGAWIMVVLGITVYTVIFLLEQTDYLRS